MNIRGIKHRGLRRFLENDDPRELRPDLVNRARNILTALVAAADMQGVQGPPGWRIQRGPRGNLERLRFGKLEDHIRSRRGRHHELGFRVPLGDP